MKKLNLLPSDYLAARQRARRHRRFCAAGAGVAAVIVVWVASGWWQIGQVSRQIAAARQEHAAILAVRPWGDADPAAIQQQCQTMRTLLAVRSRVETPMPARAMLSVISSRLPETVILTQLSVEMPAPAESPPAARPGRPADNGDASGERPIRLEIEALTLTNADVARLMSQLSHDPLFSHVTLTRSRQVTIDGRQCVAVQMTMNLIPNIEAARALPLPAADARSRTPQPTPNREVADAF